MGIIGHPVHYEQGGYILKKTR